MDAAAALFSDHGVDATSVSDVAKKAGCSVGAVYHHFRDKQALIYALFDRMIEEIQATTELGLDPARWAGATVIDILQGYLEFSLTEGRDMARLKSALLDFARQHAELGQQLEDHGRQLTLGLTQLLLIRKSEIGHPDPDLAIAMVLDQLNALLRNRKGEHTHDMFTDKHSDEVFSREALRSCAAYLELNSSQN
tara:strand:+ start:34887 stop:35468 length:582 start_codon:yes stop_codon:yes gene_type:complete